MNGIINVLKPPGMTSHDVVSYLRKVLNMKKVGHTGTLDPEAAGVLPVCVGKATKAVQYLTDKQKSYRANIKFGTVTDTYDSYGQVIKENESVAVDRKALEDTLKSFTGTISQKPPVYSAVKIKGRKLYQYALEGKEVQIAERTVEIYELKLVEMISENEAIIDVLCSKGTYIRSLCYDIGEALGCGAHMSQLIRLGSSPFSIEDSHTLEEIKAAAEENRISDILISVEILFKHYNSITIKASALKSVTNGNPLFEQGVLNGFEGLSENEDIRIYGEDYFIGTGTVQYDEIRQRLFVKLKNIFI
ncbi:MAG TPA: tRNA pseudouridine(55) synthase TruB [Bacillota bacterium]|jgi:tRNA pseudouridine55 synthase|nr:tRNA pseudouridine(55) synthase TruB [Bacillota bacterium]HQE65825.1 tRNA pseudouridine(55) synthase TruB [Bacillota bacterium]HQJ37587.1 tRNA pseudouridine(55) synthase TruB [Bacillota bacterium]HRS20295.1 tRNA pseudouridine(55) synthase TruB [Clostridia bacterium]